MEFGGGLVRYFEVVYLLHIIELKTGPGLPSHCISFDDPESSDTSVESHQPWICVMIISVYTPRLRRMVSRSLC